MASTAASAASHAASAALDTVSQTVDKTTAAMTSLFHKATDAMPKPSSLVPDLFKPTTTLQPAATLPHYTRHPTIKSTPATSPSTRSRTQTPERGGHHSRQPSPHTIIIESFASISDATNDGTLDSDHQYAAIQTDETYDYRIGEYQSKQALAELEQKDERIKKKLQKRAVKDKAQKQAKTLFGATMIVEVNDEVRLTVWILLIVASILVVSFFIYQSVTGGVSLAAFQSPDHEQGLAVIIGGVFATLATILSIIQIKAHYRHWVHPPSQRCVVRILFMVPVYSLSAWASCAFLQWSLYIDFVRVAYEAFVVYTFMLLLTKYLGGHEGVSEALQYKSDLPWPAPMNWCLKPVKPTVTYLNWMKYGTLQYTLCAPVLSLMAVVLNMYGLYGDGEIDGTQGYVYVSWILNCSQMLALYCLVWLYVTLKNELAPFSPMAKFLVVKGVVFFTFWQGVGIALMVHFGYIKSITCDVTKDPTCTPDDSLPVGEVQVLLQDFIVCIEMFIAAAVHKYTFGYETYANGTMTLLMEQRAIRLAEITYQRAVEAQRRADAIERGEDPDLVVVSNELKITELTLDERAVLDEHIKQHLEQQEDGDLLVAESGTGLSALLPWDESDMTTEFQQHRSYHKPRPPVGSVQDSTKEIEMANMAMQQAAQKAHAKLSSSGPHRQTSDQRSSAQHTTAASHPPSYSDNNKPLDVSELGDDDDQFHTDHRAGHNA